MEKFTKLKDLIASVENDADKFYNGGNNAAGTRVRKALQDIKGLASETQTANRSERRRPFHQWWSDIITTAESGQTTRCLKQEKG